MGAAARWAVYVAVVAAAGWFAYGLAVWLLSWAAARGTAPAPPGLADVEDVIAAAIRITREAAP